ncbi:MAG: hypothetical protein GKS01_17405 [Alphaproteobacteria bacterium]|nr:hypothetical protein [Alphaproteobacteria bacterium]
MATTAISVAWTGLTAKFLIAILAVISIYALFVAKGTALDAADYRKRIYIYVAVYVIVTIFMPPIVEEMAGLSVGFLIVSTNFYLFLNTMARRFVDTGRSHWHGLWYFVPFINLGVIIWLGFAKKQPTS